MPFARTLFAFAALTLAACSSPAEFEQERVVGVISIYSDRENPDALVVPDTVMAGRSFTAEVVTYGSSSCTRAAGARLRMDGLLAEIVPYDHEATGPGIGCTDDLRPYPRSVLLRFETAGVAVVRVRGVTTGGAPAVTERRVVVR